MNAHPSPLPVLPVATAVHDNPCHHCPSRDGSSDPECDDILLMGKDVRASTCFPCGWRGEKLCRGYVALMGLTDAEAMDGYRKSLDVP
jgi:hypothetical protein